jgi:hypothetical protein
MRRLEVSAFVVIALTLSLAGDAAGSPSGSTKCPRSPNGSSFAVYPTAVGCVRLVNPGTRYYLEDDLTLMVKRPNDPVPWPVRLRTGTGPPATRGWLLNEKAAQWKTWFLVAWPYVYVSAPPGGLGMPESYRSMIWRVSRVRRAGGGYRARLVSARWLTPGSG